MDIPFMIPIRALSQAGDIDPDLAMEITRKLVTAFFDKHLKKDTMDLLALESEYDMLNIRAYYGDSLRTGR